MCNLSKYNHTASFHYLWHWAVKLDLFRPLEFFVMSGREDNMTIAHQSPTPASPRFSLRTCVDPDGEHVSDNPGYLLEVTGNQDPSLTCECWPHAGVYCTLVSPRLNQKAAAEFYFTI